jgi:hypothetical protein
MKTMFRVVAVAVFTSWLLIAAARAAEVRYDYDKTADVSSWKGWSWKLSLRPQEIGLEEARIREELAQGFAAKGYREVEPGEADFRVDYRGLARPQARISDTWSPGLGRDLRVDKQVVGTLVVEVYDAKSGRLVWWGAVTDALAKDPEKADKKTERAVTKLLKKFPSPAGT